MPAGVSTLAPLPICTTIDVEQLSTTKAFTILQKDGLDTTLPVLHVNGLDDDDSNEDEDEEDDDDDSDASRLTTIRRNIRNNESSVFEHQQFSKSSDHLAPVIHQQGSNRLRTTTRDYSKSQSNLVKKWSHHEYSYKSNSMHLSTEDFNQLLSSKLKRIQQQEEEEQRRQAGKGKQLRHPKPFFTTVKSGEFLMPPPEVAVLLGITPSAMTNSSDSDDVDALMHSRTKIRQQLVSLNRKPEVRHHIHNAKCRPAVKAVPDFILGGPTSIPPLESVARRKYDRWRKEPQLQTFPSCTPHAFPKKLDPIEGAVKMLPTSWQQTRQCGNYRLQQKILRETTETQRHRTCGNLYQDRKIVHDCKANATQVLMPCDQSQVARQMEARRRQNERKKCQLQQKLRLGTPPPVAGRKHEPVQTELFLEELFERPDELEVACQTDYYLDRPATPPFCPPKRGEDVATQIEPGDLFDFDVEVQPILEVLVGKTIEQSLTEVLEEEEVASLREQQRKFLELRAAEKAEQQRLEEQDRRLREEKDRRVKQHEEAVKIQKETEERVAAAVLLTGYIAELLPAVLESLKLSGYLLDEIKADVEEGFMPWLMKEVKKEMGTMVQSREILEEIVKEIIKNRANTYRQLGEEYDATLKLKVESFVDICVVPDAEEGEEHGFSSEGNEEKEIKIPE